jgi:hypothetical protein
VSGSCQAPKNCILPIYLTLILGREGAPTIFSESGAELLPEGLPLCPVHYCRAAHLFFHTVLASACRAHRCNRTQHHRPHPRMQRRCLCHSRLARHLDSDSPAADLADRSLWIDGRAGWVVVNNLWCRPLWLCPVAILGDMGHPFGIRPRVKTVCVTVRHPTKQERQRCRCHF